mgnify:CR=1 FL=1|jgi:hypothetical protein
MKITVRAEKNYGIEVIYPHDEAAQIFARIAGKKTLTSHALRDIAALGYSIEVYTPTPRTIAAMEAAR